MYSIEKRMKAIELYIKYDRCAADVIRKLGYPDRKTLRNWYKAYLEEQETGVTGNLGCRRKKYSQEQMVTAVEYYLEHGHNLSRTIRALGYPSSRGTLRSWCDELAPGSRKTYVGGVKYDYEQKQEAVIALCTRNSSADEVAEEYAVTRQALYSWKNILLGKGDEISMSKEENVPLPEEKEELLAEIERLKCEIRKLKLEKDVLIGTMEILKKDPGVDPKNLTNKEKTLLVDALRSEYRLKELLSCPGLARSTYFY